MLNSPLARLARGICVILAIGAVSGCIPPPRTDDLTTTHPERATLLGRFNTIRPLYGYRDEEDPSRMSLCLSVVTPFGTDRNGHFGPEPLAPDETFPTGSRVEVTRIERYVNHRSPDRIMLVGRIWNPQGQAYPMDHLRYIDGAPDLVGPAWR